MGLFSEARVATSEMTAPRFSSVDRISSIDEQTTVGHASEWSDSGSENRELQSTLFTSTGSARDETNQCRTKGIAERFTVCSLGGLLILGVAIISTLVVFLLDFTDKIQNVLLILAFKDHLLNDGHSWLRNVERTMMGGLPEDWGVHSSMLFRW